MAQRRTWQGARQMGHFLCARFKLDAWRTGAAHAACINKMSANSCRPPRAHRARLPRPRPYQARPAKCVPAADGDGLDQQAQADGALKQRVRVRGRRRRRGRRCRRRHGPRRGCHRAAEGRRGPGVPPSVLCTERWAAPEAAPHHNFRLFAMRRPRSRCRCVRCIARRCRARLPPPSAGPLIFPLRLAPRRAAAPVPRRQRAGVDEPPPPSALAQSARNVRYAGRLPQTQGACSRVHRPRSSAPRARSIGPRSPSAVDGARPRPT